MTSFKVSMIVLMEKEISVSVTDVGNDALVPRPPELCVHDHILASDPKAREHPSNN
ncbi:8450_t:CDS:2, partial [Ambispora gerdemannii]